jgi:hypothetical protein
MLAIVAAVLTLYFYVHRFIVFPISYYADLDVLRTVAHIVSVGGVVSTFAKVAFS